MKLLCYEAVFFLIFFAKSNEPVLPRPTGVSMNSDKIIMYYKEGTAFCVYIYIYILRFLIRLVVNPRDIRKRLNFVRKYIRNLFII